MRTKTFYLRPNISFDIIQIENGFLYVYNYQGWHFRVFNSKIAFQYFLKHNIDASIFDTEDSEQLNSFIKSYKITNVFYITFLDFSKFQILGVNNDFSSQIFKNLKIAIRELKKLSNSSIKQYGIVMTSVEQMYFSKYLRTLDFGMNTILSKKRNEIAKEWIRDFRKKENL